MDRLSLIVLVVCGVVAALVVARRRPSRPPPRVHGPISSRVLRVDLSHREHDDEP